MWIGHRQEDLMITLALRRSESIRSDEGLALEASAFESLYGGQFTLSTQLIKPNYQRKLMQLSMLCPRGWPRDEVGTLNVLVHPRWGILANFEHECWPWDREVGSMLKRWKRTGFWMRVIRLFRHLESTQKSQKFELSVPNFPVAIKWRNEMNLTNHCFFFNIYVLVNKYSVSVPKSHWIFM